MASLIVCVAAKQKYTPRETTILKRPKLKGRILMLGLTNLTIQSYVPAFINQIKKPEIKVAFNASLLFWSLTRNAIVMKTLAYVKYDNEYHNIIRI